MGGEREGRIGWGGGRSGNYFLGFGFAFLISLDDFSSPSVVFVLVGGLGVTICFNDCCPACILHSVCVSVSQSTLPEAPPPAPTPLKHWNLFVCRRLFFALTSGGGPGAEKLAAKEAEVPQLGGSDCSRWDIWGVPTALRICSQVTMAQYRDHGEGKPSKKPQVHGLIAARSNRAAISLLPFVTLLAFHFCLCWSMF